MFYCYTIFMWVIWSINKVLVTFFNIFLSVHYLKAIKLTPIKLRSMGQKAFENSTCIIACTKNTIQIDRDIFL
ncbi:hypothetical protein G000_25626 [Klebsiella pneumoniae ATCC BAA-2146]|nr:hypothetical protein G000_25626 [Klebsiella pneumoniae ATCC BAA-2146]